jgi:magnesium-transporting ATPase (P-type)
MLAVSVGNASSQQAVHLGVLAMDLILFCGTVLSCRYGPNALTPPKKPGFWAKLRAQLNNVLIFILLAAAVVVAALQEWIEFGLILGVVTVNVMIGMIQEGKAEKAAEAIKAMLSSSGRARHSVDPAAGVNGASTRHAPAP